MGNTANTPLPPAGSPLRKLGKYLARLVGAERLFFGVSSPQAPEQATSPHFVCRLREDALWGGEYIQTGYNDPAGFDVFSKPQPATLPAELALAAVRYAEEEGPSQPDRAYLELVAEYIERHSQPAAVPNGYTLVPEELGDNKKMRHALFPLGTREEQDAHWRDVLEAATTKEPR